MGTRAFWAGVAERALKTAAQTAAALLAADGVNLLTLDWTAVGATVGLATALSVLQFPNRPAAGEPSNPSNEGAS
mgnify:CR=1 FL=1